MKRLLLVIALMGTLILGTGVASAFAEGEWINGQFDEIVWNTPGEGENGFTDVGHVSTYMSADGKTLKVVFFAWVTWPYGDYALAETHLAVAPTVEALPHSNGGLVPGRFEFKTEHDPWVFDRYTYYVDVSQIPADQDIVIAAHAVVVRLSDGRTETGWATGCYTDQWAYDGANWGRYYVYRR